MLKEHPAAKKEAKRIVSELSDHALTKSHARHLSAEKCHSIGLNVRMLEQDPKLQDAVLTVHHACIHTLSATPAFKLIENHKGVAFIQMQTMVLQQPANLEGPKQAEHPPDAQAPAIEEEPTK